LLYERRIMTWFCSWGDGNNFLDFSHAALSSPLSQNTEPDKVCTRAIEWLHGLRFVLN
jgi:hypothetical protein